MARKNTITKTCTRTGFTITGTEDEVAEHFYRDKSQKDNFSPWSKDAEREYNKAYRAGLEKAKAPRKADADAKGVTAFNRTMTAMGARTTRKAKASARKVDGTRTTKAKAQTRARKTARKVKVTHRAPVKRTSPVNVNAR
jgi:hypothetical protein